MALSSYSCVNSIFFQPKSLFLVYTKEYHKTVDWLLFFAILASVSLGIVKGLNEYVKSHNPMGFRLH